MDNTSHCEEQTTVFLTNEDKNEVYRIPALFFDRHNKVLLAFAEKRRTSNDATTEALVMKTGKFVKDETNHQTRIQWSESTNVVEKKHLGGYRPMNPCPVYEKNSGKLFLFFICVEGTVSEAWQRFWGISKARLCYITTTDAGQTWTDLTDLSDKQPEIKEWATFALGPGHGLQTQAGRLIVPAYGYGSCSRSCFCISCFCAVSRALCLHSDDKGATWQFGNMLEEKSVECQMAEVSDDKGNRLYCNARSEGGYRVEAVSENSGEEFLTLPAAGKLVETGRGCQGSVVSFPAQPEKANSAQVPQWLLYSHPTSQSKRVDLGVYLNRSPQDPHAWSKPWIINKGPSGYSDLAYIDEGWFACLMERGEASEIEQIACNVFSYDQVKENVGLIK
ncbi:sialidase-4-like [Melanotaenia boesemani]|uniref:sialidase-4-like n=1 Tax=Melanotaenia boesemani TaxID=1250792 RepID=UPI001C04542C|nr:sialidase-4-like [Melanotaenia boesemani]XP_041825636.1 sialidase-4-like [Melanotaenia boesemani]